MKKIPDESLFPAAPRGGGHDYVLIWDQHGKRYVCRECGAILGLDAIICQGPGSWRNKSKRS